MITQTKLYEKHHSFQDFISSRNVDIEVQRVKVVNFLKANISAIKDEKKHLIIQSALEDLEISETKKINFLMTRHIADEIANVADELIPQYIYHRYRYDVYPKQKVLDDYPPYLQIEPSSMCNYRCVFCYQVDQGFSKKSSRHMGTMNFDMFKAIIDQAVGNIEFISIASRGEPLICKDIDQMLEYCVGKFLGLKMNTNASLLNEKHCHAILAGGVNMLVFSADAAEEPLYSQLRVNGNLDKVIKNIKLFQKIKKKHYPKSKIITRVSGVRYTQQQDISKMEEAWSELVDQITFVNYNPWENIYKTPANFIKSPCSDLWRRMFVWHDGQINPCDVDYKSTLPISKNVQEASIFKIWRSKEYENLREIHLQEKRCTMSPCQACVLV